MEFYTLLKYVHVVLAIVAVGFNLSYAIWLRRLAGAPEHAVHVLSGIKTLDDRFANPAYALLLVTGIVLVVVGDIGFTTFWIAAALVLYLVLLVVAIAVFTPNLRAQIDLAEQGRMDTGEYRALSRSGAVVGAVLGVLVLTIEFLMVTKPTF